MNSAIERLLAAVFAACAMWAICFLVEPGFAMMETPPYGPPTHLYRLVLIIVLGVAATVVFLTYRPGWWRAQKEAPRITGRGPL